MAEYTKNDQDILHLPIDKQVDYNFYLLNYTKDIHGTQQINNGLSSLSSLSSPMKVIEQIRDPRKMITCIIYILIFLLLLALGFYFIVYWFYMNYKSSTLGGEVHTFNPLLLNYKANPKVIYLITYIPVLIGLVIVILICLFFYKSYLYEIQRTYQILSQKNKENDILSSHRSSSQAQNRSSSNESSGQSSSNESSNQSSNQSSSQSSSQAQSQNQSSNQAQAQNQSSSQAQVQNRSPPSIPIIIPITKSVPFITNSNSNNSNNMNIALEMGKAFLRDFRFRT